MNLQCSSVVHLWIRNRYWSIIAPIDLRVFKNACYKFYCRVDTVTKSGKPTLIK